MNSIHNNNSNRTSNIVSNPNGKPITRGEKRPFLSRKIHVSDHQISRVVNSKNSNKNLSTFSNGNKFNVGLPVEENRDFNHNESKPYKRRHFNNNSNYNNYGSNNLNSNKENSQILYNQNTNFSNQNSNFSNNNTAYNKFNNFASEKTNNNSNNNFITHKNPKNFQNNLHNNGNYENSNVNGNIANSAIYSNTTFVDRTERIPQIEKVFSPIVIPNNKISISKILNTHNIPNSSNNITSELKSMVQGEIAKFPVLQNIGCKSSNSLITVPFSSNPHTNIVNNVFQTTAITNSIQAGIMNNIYVSNNITNINFTNGGLNKDDFTPCFANTKNFMSKTKNQNQGLNFQNEKKFSNAKKNRKMSHNQNSIQSSAMKNNFVQDNSSKKTPKNFNRKHSGSFNFLNSNRNNQTDSSHYSNYDNHEILVVNIKLNNENKTIKINKYDDYYLTAKDFCESNNLSENLIKPISLKLNSAVASINQVFNSKLTNYDKEYLNSLNTLWKDQKNNFKLDSINNNNKDHFLKKKTREKNITPTAVLENLCEKVNICDISSFSVFTQDLNEDDDTDVGSILNRTL